MEFFILSRETFISFEDMLQKWLIFLITDVPDDGKFNEGIITSSPGPNL